MSFLKVIIKDQPDIAESIYLLYGINLFNTVITYFYSYRSSLLIAAQQNYIVVGINYLITILQSVIQIIALMYTHNYMAYILIQTIGTLIYNVSVSKAAKNKFPCITRKNVKLLPDDEKRILFENIRDLTFYKISGLLVNSTDNILITFFQGLTTTGIASNYTLLVNTLNSLLGQVFNGLTASIGNHNAIESEEKKYEMFNFMNFMNFWIFGWGTLGIVFCSSKAVGTPAGYNISVSTDANGNIKLISNFTTYTKKLRLKLSKTSYVYNGKNAKPKVTVYNGRKKVSRKYYKVTYKNNKNTGYATVIVKGKGKFAKYAGKATFTIKPKTPKKPVVKKGAKKTLNVRWYRDAQATKYVVQYSQSSKFKGRTTKTVTINSNKTGKIVLKGLTSRKNYYVRVRSCKVVNGKAIWGSYSKATKMKVK